MEMIFLRSVISKLQNNYVSDSEKVRMHTGVIWPRGVNIGNRPLPSKHTSIGPMLAFRPSIGPIPSNFNIVPQDVAGDVFHGAT